MCDTRKGTSTRYKHQQNTTSHAVFICYHVHLCYHNLKKLRKPRLNPQLVPQVLNPAQANKSRRDKESKERDKSERKSDGNATSRNSKTRPRLFENSSIN